MIRGKYAASTDALREAFLRSRGCTHEAVLGWWWGGDISAASEIASLGSTAASPTTAKLLKYLTCLIIGAYYRPRMM